MAQTRVVLTFALLALTCLALATAPAEASPDNVYVCVIGVNGCAPGNLAEVHVKGQEVDVPDPCYTTACF